MSWIRTLLPGASLPAAILLLATLASAQGTPSGAQSVQMDSMGMTSLRLYRTGYWAELRADLINRTPADRTPLIAATVDQMNQVQFVTRPWLPAMSQRRVKLPIRLTVKVPADQRAWPATAQLIEPGAGSGGERELTATEVLLLVYHDRISTGMVVDGHTDEQNNAARRLVRVMRELDTGLGPATASINQNDLPDHPAGFDALDTLVVALGEPSLDAMQLRTLREWVLDGGRLWLMLDQTPADFGAQLFGNEWKITELDRLELTDLTLERGQTQERQQFDYPVTFVRTVSDGWETLHTIDGYPASMRRGIGFGEVFVTTLGAQAWMKENNTQPTDSVKLMRDWLRVREGQDRDLAQQETFDSFVQQQIGYRILGLPPVSTVLGLYLVVLIAAGFYLVRRDRLEWLSIIGVALSLGAAGLLVMLGLGRQTQSPTTLAVAQVGYFLDDQPYVSLNDRVSVYRSPAHEGELGLAGEAGAAWPSLAAQGGQVLRFEHLPPLGWRMERLNLPTGAVTDVRMTQMQRLEQTAAAVVAWDAAGAITGRIEGSAPTALEDAVLASRDGHMAVSVTEDGAFTGTLDGVLGPGQFISAAVLSQTQQNRLRVYRELFEQADFRQRPSLVGWTAAMPAGLSLGDGVNENAAGVFSLPLRFERPAAGGRVTLPFPLLRMDMLRNVPNIVSSSIFDDRSRSFVADVSQEGDVMLRFTVPPQLLPLQLDEVRLNFDITALGRDVHVLVYRDEQPQQVATFTSPNQVQTLTLSGDQLPDLHADGWLGVGLRIAPGQPGQAAKWTLKNFHAHLLATALPGDDE